MFLGEKSDASMEAGKMQDKPVISYSTKQETAQKMIGLHQKIEEVA